MKSNVENDDIPVFLKHKRSASTVSKQMLVMHHFNLTVSGIWWHFMSATCETSAIPGASSGVILSRPEAFPETGSLFSSPMRLSTESHAIRLLQWQPTSDLISPKLPPYHITPTLSMKMYVVVCAHYSAFSNPFGTKFEFEIGRNFQHQKWLVCCFYPKL